MFKIGQECVRKWTGEGVKKLVLSPERAESLT